MTTPRPRGRTLIGRLAIMGVATLASATVMAPAAALADDLAPEAPSGTTDQPVQPETTEPEATPPASQEPTDTAPADEGTSTEESPAASSPAKAASLPANLAPPSAAALAADDTADAAEVAAADEMAPVFGTGKNRSYRVDTRISPDAFAPAGTTTAGSTFTITTTLDDGTESTVTCTTAAATVTGARGYSTCPGPSGSGFPLNTYNAPPTATKVTIAQVTAPENLVVNPEPFVLLPCTTGAAGCVNIRNSGIEQDGSILPITVDDELTVPAGSDPVRVDVLANDTSDDPNTTLTVTQPPEGQGTVRVVNNARGMALRYTPPATFTGVVPITYTVTNSNGSTDGTLTVTVQDREFGEAGTNRGFRVTASIDPDAFVPGDNPSSAGSTFSIVNTFNNQPDSEPIICTSVASNLAGTVGYSGCARNGNPPVFGIFPAPTGATSVVITQLTAPDGLAVDPEPYVLLPCTTGEAGCGQNRNTDFLLTGTVLPVTVDDAVTVSAGGDPVRVDVLANDTSDDPNTTLTVTQPPEGQGTVRVVTNNRGVQVLRYVPPATFTGLVPITYTVTNSNGSTDGTLNVTVQDREFADSPANRGFRVTASIDPDADVPDDASSAGSTFSIVNTYNDQEDSEPVICTSVAASSFTGQIGYSGCERNGSVPVFGIFPAPVGATSVVITQLTAPDGLAVDPEPYVLLPCTTGEDGCGQNRNTDFLLTAGPVVPAPVTVDDTATATAGGDPVDVDVLDNDTSDSPVTGLTVTQPPAGQGSVEVIGAPVDPAARATGAGTLQLRYTPSADFTGDVAITYTVSNAGGSTDGTLTVTVEAADVVVPPGNGDGGDNGDGNGVGNGNGDDTDDVADEVAGNDGRVDVVGGDLPNAGGPGAELLGIGALLVAAGGAITLRARRRTSGVRAH